MTLLTAGQVVLDRYVIEHPLRRGAMGEVYASRHTLLEPPVALEVLLPLDTDDALARFEREGCLMARVRSPYVVRLLDFIGWRARCRSTLPVEAGEASSSAPSTGLHVRRRSVTQTNCPTNCADWSNGSPRRQAQPRKVDRYHS